MGPHTLGNPITQETRGSLLSIRGQGLNDLTLGGNNRVEKDSGLEKLEAVQKGSLTDRFIRRLHYLYIRCCFWVRVGLRDRLRVMDIISHASWEMFRPRKSA